MHSIGWKEKKKNGRVPGWKEAYIIYIYIYIMIHYHDDGNEKKKNLLCFIGLVCTRDKWVMVWVIIELDN